MTAEPKPPFTEAMVEIAQYAYDRNIRLYPLANHGTAMRAALTALASSGFVILPREATEAMWDAGGHAVQVVIDCNGGTPSECASDYAVDVYRAMRDAAIGKESV